MVWEFLGMLSFNWIGCVERLESGPGDVVSVLVLDENNIPQNSLFFSHSRPEIFPFFRYLLSKATPAHHF